MPHLSIPVPQDSLSQWFLQIPPNSRSRDMHNLSVTSPWKLGDKMCLGAGVLLQRWRFAGRGCGLCCRSQQGHLASYIVSCYLPSTAPALHLPAHSTSPSPGQGHSFFPLHRGKLPIEGQGQWWAGGLQLGAAVRAALVCPPQLVGPACPVTLPVLSAPVSG